jgi:hypothetical protein
MSSLREKWIGQALLPHVIREGERHEAREIIRQVEGEEGRGQDSHTGGMEYWKDKNMRRLHDIRGRR